MGIRYNNRSLVFFIAFPLLLLPPAFARKKKLCHASYQISEMVRFIQLGHRVVEASGNLVLHIFCRTEWDPKELQTGPHLTISVYDVKGSRPVFALGGNLQHIGPSPPQMPKCR